ncbi:hypothetical protein [Clostridium cylindrosporum]|uniref:Uncharacterized protein n=1 Tax=Clostridium cylindrosporum DSM 605 TaxID=1121307 RepID=A0A0J8D9T6_CLOCY|nr:hypothetical protein [Clostridium cylindrosporum]KMT22602.1 hypothetical protein CLCY_9c00330 [Clostridium cylindrosporum DSM 605]
MSKYRTMSLIFGLSIIVAVFGLYRLDTATKSKGNSNYLVDINTKSNLKDISNTWFSKLSYKNKN